MAEAITHGVVSHIAAQDSESGAEVVRLVVYVPHDADIGVLYERHHAERLLQLYGGRPVAVMESNGRRWIRAMSQPTVAAVSEVEALARKTLASLRMFGEERTYDAGDLRSIVAVNLSATDDGKQPERDQCPIYCTLPQHEQLEALACVPWKRLTEK